MARSARELAGLSRRDADLSEVGVVMKQTQQPEPELTGAPRKPLPLVSRIIDHVTDALGHEIAVILAVVLVLAWFAGLPHFGLADQNYQLLINTGTTIITFIMVFAVQHTSNRDAKALHVKLDELLRATDARTELIGVEGETTRQIQERKDELIAAREAETAKANGA